MNGKAVREIAKICGDKNVFTGAQALSRYFRDKVSSTGLVLVTPQTVEQVSDTVSFCSENEIPVFSVRGRYVEDETLAGKEGILIDLRKMSEVKKIDRENLSAYIFAGVTFEDLKEKLAKEGMKILYPVSGTTDSVLRSYIDREMLLGSTCNRHLQYSLFHAVLATGEIWVSGSQQITDEGHADFREDQGPQMSPFFGASQDIFGIPFYGVVYTYPIREERKVVAYSFEDLDSAASLVYKVSRSEWCFEAFLANDCFLSVALSGGARESVAQIKRKFKPWTAVVSFEHHKELVELWDKYTRDAARELGGKEIKGQAQEMIEKSLESPWYFYDRDSYRGRCSNVCGFQYFKNLTVVFSTIEEQAAKNGVKPQEIGKIIVPTYFGGSAYCEADIYFNPENNKEMESAQKTVNDSYKHLIEDGFFVDRPRGEVAEMIFSKANPSYVRMIKNFKSIVDPKGIINPDQLIKGV